jgi:hypothetical protein
VTNTVFRPLIGFGSAVLLIFLLRKVGVSKKA